MTIIPHTNITPLALADAYLLGYAPNTRQAYKGDLTDWFEFCDDPFAATRATVDAYARHMGEVRGLSRATIARRLAAVTGYYKRAVEEGILDKNPALGVRRPSTARDSQTTGLTASEAKTILGMASLHSDRMGALVGLMLYDGLRISEALGAEADDVRHERGMHVLDITRKGGHRRTIPLSPTVVALLADHLQGRQTGRIFPMDRSTAFRLLKQVAAKAVPGKNISPHSLRHTFVTLSLDAGVPLHVVQDACDHSKPETTQGYNRARNNLDNHPTWVLESRLA